jgi:hypothetical protein
MPNRILRESILTSDRVNQLDAGEERFYRRLMSVVDDYGRFDARPGVLRAACFPLLLDKVREADCSRWMAACQKAGLIALYDSDSKPYLILRKLGEPRARHSKYPNPPPALTCAHLRADVPYAPSPAPTPIAHANGVGVKGKLSAHAQQREADKLERQRLSR